MDAKDSFIKWSAAYGETYKDKRACRYDRHMMIEFGEFHANDKVKEAANNSIKRIEEMAEDHTWGFVKCANVTEIIKEEYYKSKLNK